MKTNYKLFRAYCLTAICILGALLFAVGLCTAKFQTDETVFKATYSTVGVFSSDDSVTVNLGGKIISFTPSEIAYVFEKVRLIFLAPINNLIELVRVAVSQL